MKCKLNKFKRKTDKTYKLQIKTKENYQISSMEGKLEEIQI